MSDENIRPEIANMPVEQMEAIVENHTPAPEHKPSLFDAGQDADKKLTAAMNAIYTKSEARAERADVVVPSIKAHGKDPYGNPMPGHSLDEAFEKTYDFLHATKAEQKTQLEAHQLMKQVRENAAKFSVTLDDQGAMFAAMQLEEALAKEAKEQADDPWQPAAQEISRHYPGQAPHEIARGYAQLESRFRSDPVAGFSEMAHGIGQHPVAIAQQVIARYSQQQPQISQADYQAAYGIVDRTTQSLPRFNELEPDILAVIQDGNFKKTGNYEQDLRRAYNTAVQRDKKRSTADRMDRSMRASYAKIAGRK